MKKFLTISGIALMLLSGKHCRGKVVYTDTTGWRVIVREISALKTLSYSYKIEGTFPNGQTDRVAGKIYINRDAGILFSSDNARTQLYDNAWYYLADHRGKKLTVVNLSRRYTPAERQKLEKYFLNNAYTAEYMDSVVLKKGFLRDYKVSGDTVKFSVGFPKGSVEKQFDIAYNRKTQLPVSMHAEFFYSWKQGKSDYGGTTEQIICNGYRKSIDPKQYDAATYFTVSGGKLRLKKYNKYLLKTEL